jgi:hypothetical protein
MKEKEKKLRHILIARIQPYALTFFYQLVQKLYKLQKKCVGNNMCFISVYSSVGIVTRQRDGQRRKRGSIPVGGTTIASPAQCSGADTASHSLAIGRSFPSG